MQVTKSRFWSVLAALAIVLLCLPGTHAADSVLFRYIPVLDVVHLSTSDQGCFYISDQLCRQAGSYIPSDVTTTLHDKLGEVAGAAKSGTWYGFLGADTVVDLAYSNRRNLSLGVPECPRGLGDSYTGANDNRYASTIWVYCIWRWRSGRWLDATDIAYPSYPKTISDAKVYVKGPGYGVSFASGNEYSALYSFDSEFPMYFKTGTDVDAGGVTLTANLCSNVDCGLRPGTAHGRQLMSAGSGSKFTWSDGRVQGGYIYTQLKCDFASPFCGTTEVRDEVGFDDPTTISNHVTLCMMYSPARYDKELYNTSSQIQGLWWVIYFVILFVICLIIFIVAVCCQEREDMDEPPEDAPEWADNEATNTQKPKRVVSQHAFRQQPNDDFYDDDDGGKYEELDGPNENPLGSQRNTNVSWQ